MAVPLAGEAAPPTTGPHTLLPYRPTGDLAAHGATNPRRAPSPLPPPAPPDNAPGRHGQMRPGDASGTLSAPPLCARLRHLVSQSRLGRPDRGVVLAGAGNLGAVLPSGTPALMEPPFQ